MSFKREPIEIFKLLFSHLLNRIKISGIVNLKPDSLLKIRPHRAPHPIAAAAHIVVTEVIRDCIMHN